MVGEPATGQPLTDGGESMNSFEFEKQVLDEVIEAGKDNRPSPGDLFVKYRNDKEVRDFFGNQSAKDFREKFEHWVQEVVTFVDDTEGKPLFRKEKELDIATKMLASDLKDTAATLDLDNPRDVRDLLGAIGVMLKQTNENTIRKVLDITEEAGADCEVLRERFLVLFPEPEKDEPEEKAA